MFSQTTARERERAQSWDCLWPPFRLEFDGVVEIYKDIIFENNNQIIIEINAIF